MGFLKRKGTQDSKKLPEDFDSIKSNFVKRVYDCRQEHHIPDDMLINWDQTGVNRIPGGEWTMVERGNKQVTITGIDDKRQITSLLAVSMTGEFLPPQVLYAGKTNRCHPAVEFPNGWDVHHNENHWSNAASMNRYVDTIVIPFMERTRILLGLPNEQKGLAIFDVFRADQDKTMLDKLHTNNI